MRAVVPRGPVPVAAVEDLWDVRPDDLAAAGAACRRLPDRQPLSPALVTDLTSRARTARDWRGDVQEEDGHGSPSPRALLTASHARALRRIVEVHGWPGFRLVGVEGSLAALEIALLCGDGPFLRRLLRGIEVALREQDAVPVFGALLHDRACVLDGQHQWYGSQQWAGAEPGVLWTVEAPDLLAERRAGVGFASLEGAVFHDAAVRTAVA
ncbi:hypothetical protein [Streptomyces yaizuensis]|uniref:Uncharacterized protein n=1 Tax=Streptomyces yaizuensis TaxID=2989713 RepID=A0ABQ5P6B0_9ACTN|nr:hypothetical protein [Streptomyces sp. YSPA8]GLF98132.1 hypothetical protein SYYSPA8_27565 [Streptomyces sp. YSPA8]